MLVNLLQKAPVKQGRPLMVGPELDKMVQYKVRGVRDAAGVVD